MEKIKKFFADEKVKKALSITRSVLVWAMIIISVGMMVFTIISVNVFNNRDIDIFGYKAFIVLSDSMSSEEGDASKGHFNAGDLIIVKETDISELRAGDIISFISTNPDSYDETVTHMIKEVTTDKMGLPGFITYGTATGAVDTNVVDSPYVLGKYQFKLPGVGNFFSFLKTTPGYIVCILIPFLILIGMQGLNSIRLFKQYKAEEMAELEAARKEEQQRLDAERAALAEERKKQEEMMKKLLEMQEALQKKSDDNNSEN